MVKEQIVDWLRVFRAQTTPSLLIVFVLFYTLAGGNVFSWHGLGLILWAILSHWTIYGSNSAFDSYIGHDQLDPYKQHHPIVDGRIKVETAMVVTSIMWIGVVLSGVVLILFSPTHWYGSLVGYSEWALICLLLACIFAMTYNLTSKATIFKHFFGTPPAPLIASACYFMVLTDNFLNHWLIHEIFITSLVFLVGYTLYSFWGGDYKDLKHPNEVNIIHRMGAKLEGSYLELKKSRLFADVSLGVIVTCGAIIAILIPNQFILPVLGGLVALVLFFHYKVMKDQPFDREESFSNYMKVVLTSALILPLVYIPISGWLVILLLVLVGIVWLLITNRILWGTWIKPGT